MNPQGIKGGQSRSPQEVCDGALCVLVAVVGCVALVAALVVWGCR